ncbi:glutamate-rich protein 2 isoform X2 [Hoplias malabaricus]|uniref:glutamate-rich protein 2 isoform X2 n=1 Tax=Hoplias malabaricus TaxID=27720 RepID=UPI0034626A3B
MSRLLCVGNSSKLPEKGAVPEKEEAQSSGAPALNKSVRSKPKSLKSSTQPQWICPSAALDKGHITINFSRSQAVLQPLSRRDITMHGVEEKWANKSSPGNHNNDSEKKTLSTEFMERVHLDLPVLKEPLTNHGINDRKSEANEECEEDEETTEHHAPIELLAEFLKAVMAKEHTLAKKLCQMILIYEPENPEAKHFLPLIEQRIHIAQENSTSEEDSDEDEGGSSDDCDDDNDEINDDDKDDDDSDGCDSDEEFT